MANTPWTAGPWTKQKAKDHAGYDIKTGARPYYDIATLIGGLRGEEHYNARLIAAAPEMAELLERFANSGDNMNVLIHKARQILTRIRGEDGDAAS